MSDSLEAAEEELIYECSACNTTFTDVEDHMEKFHPNESAAEVENEDDDVDDCKDSVIVNESDINVIYDEGVAFVIKNAAGKFECSVCSKTYKVLKRFIDHVKTHGEVHEDYIKKLTEYLTEKDKEEVFDQTTAEGKSSFKCKVCNTIFETKKQMLLHWPIHIHVEAAHNKKNLLDFGEESLHCKLCNRSLNNSYEMKLHMNAHDENSAHSSRSMKEEPGKSPTKTRQMKTDGAKTYPCQYCDKEFKRPHEKVKHERVHTGEKPFSCDLCGKQFRVTYCLSLHKKNVHSEERPYVCTFEACNKRFKSQSVYNHHLKTHGTAKDFKCPFCEKAFKTSVQLSGHKNTHTKPFPCNICSRTFASLYAVKLHMQIHKNVDSALKYTCKICSAQYGRSFALNDHMKSAHPGMDIDEVEVEEHYLIAEDHEVVFSEGEVYSVVIETV